MKPTPSLPSPGEHTQTTRDVPGEPIVKADVTGLMPNVPAAGARYVKTPPAADESPEGDR